MQLRRYAHATLVLLAVLALVAGTAACSGAAATKKPTATKTPHATQVEPTDENGGDQTEEPTEEATEEPTEEPTEEATEAPTENVDDPISGVETSFTKITSYRFTMAMQGPSFDSLAPLLGGKAGDPFTMSGTIVTKPEKAAYVKMGTIEMIQIGTDKAWIKMGSSWSVSSPSSNVADSLAPDKLFGSFSSGLGEASGPGITRVGEEKKNGVQAIHYKVDASVVGDTMGSAFGLKTPATWKYDLWLAKDGGYPVSMAIVGTAGGKTVAKMVFEITNVNDPANKVTAPK